MTSTRGMSAAEMAAILEDQEDERTDELQTQDRRNKLAAVARREAKRAAAHEKGKRS